MWSHFSQNKSITSWSIRENNKANQLYWPCWQHHSISLLSQAAAKLPLRFYHLKPLFPSHGKTTAVSVWLKSADEVWVNECVCERECVDMDRWEQQLNICSFGLLTGVLRNPQTKLNSIMTLSIKSTVLTVYRQQHSTVYCKLYLNIVLHVIYRNVFHCLIRLHGNK